MADHAHTETLSLRVQFDDEAQQKDASTLGMWIFLITEIMFFGGMFAVYTVYRNFYPTVFAIASSSLNEVSSAPSTPACSCSPVSPWSWPYVPASSDRAKPSSGS